MNKGSQPSVNSTCYLSTVALANRDGTTRGLFIPRVILLTVASSGISLVSPPAPFLPTQTLFPHRDSQDLLSVRRQGIQVPKLGIRLDGPSRFPPILHCSCPQKMNTTNSGSFTFSKSTVLLIRALSTSC